MSSNTPSKDDQARDLILLWEGSTRASTRVNASDRDTLIDMVATALSRSTVPDPDDPTNDPSDPMIGTCVRCGAVRVASELNANGLCDCCDARQPGDEP